MQRLEVSGAVRPIYGSSGVKRLIDRAVFDYIPFPQYRGFRWHRGRSTVLRYIEILVQKKLVLRRTSGHCLGTYRTVINLVSVHCFLILLRHYYNNHRHLLFISFSKLHVSITINMLCSGSVLHNSFKENE